MRIKQRYFLKKSKNAYRSIWRARAKICGKIDFFIRLSRKAGTSERMIACSAMTGNACGVSTAICHRGKKLPNLVKKFIAEKAAKIEEWLSNSLDDRDIPARLKSSMLYSLRAGGKRIRPILCLSCFSLGTEDENKILPFAAAIEMIHTYSLIHDDLPAMDNDDLRRGKPANHKAFDEATAILAGDALLTDAFGIACMADAPLSFLLEALKRLSYAAGSSGMVGGQELDMLFTERKELSFDELCHMQALKTGMLIQASCLCGAILAGANPKLINSITLYGAALGAEFQIVDDILDITSTTEELGKPAGSDQKQGKATYPSLIGLQKSKEIAHEKATLAKMAIADLKGENAEFLCRLPDFILQRTA